MEQEQNQEALLAWWRNRAVMVTFFAAYMTLRYLLSPEKHIEFWYVPFSICWAISCWPQVLDKQYGIYCILPREVRKRQAKTPSYWIANLFATATVLMICGALLNSLWEVIGSHFK